MAKPFISLFDVTPNTIDKGGKVVFRWGVSNADTRTLTTKGSILPVGSWTFYPASTRTYTLTATNQEGTSKKYQTVTVIQPPPTPPPTPPPIPDEDEEPPPGECPNFWEDPVGWVLCTITNGFSVFAEWFGGAFWTFISSIRQWAAGFTLEFWLFLQDPFKYINDAIRTFILGQEQKTATDYTDLRKSEEDHWQNNTDWIAGQYKNVDDLTEEEFLLLVEKGLTDDKETLRAADFRVYKLDASSKAALETTMSTLRSEIGGVWLGIDTKTGELLDVLSDDHTYLVNYVETVESNLPDTIGDIIEGIGSFVNGGFLDFDTWALQFNLDIAGYTDSKIIDVKEWFNISLPELISPMFEWAKPLVSPILALANVLSSLWTGLTKEEDEDPKLTDYKDNFKTQTDRVKEILGRP